MQYILHTAYTKNKNKSMKKNPRCYSPFSSFDKCKERQNGKADPSKCITQGYKKNLTALAKRF